MACVVFTLSCTGGISEPVKPFVISSFEPGEKEVVLLKSGASTIIHDKEKAGDGEYCVRVQSGKKDEYNGIQVLDPNVLKAFKDYLLLNIDVYNPQADPVVFGITMRDSRSVSWGMKYNGSATAAPGKSTVEVNLTGLNRSNAKGNTSTDLVDPADVKELAVFLSPSEKPLVLYVDNLRLEASEMPVVEGLKAIDFGMKGSPVYPGFAACTEKNVWGDAVEFGWVNPGLSDNCQIPDPLTATYGSGDAFKMKLTNGKYELQTCFDPYGNWGRYPSFRSRRVLINGNEVLTQSMTGGEFLDTCYYAHEDEEDLPGQDVWDKFVARRNRVYTYPAEVTDGVLTVEVKSADKHGKWILFLVVYPEAKQAEGRKWMEALQKQRHDKFVKKIAITTPPPGGEDFAPTADEKDRGFATFVRHTELDIGVNARPAKDERGKPLIFEAAAGQRCGGQVGVYPLSESRDVTVTVSALAGDGVASLPASAIQVKKIRNFFKRPGRENIARCLPYILVDFKTLEFQPGVTRGLWVILTTPEDAKPGRYTGAMTIAAPGKTPVRIPIEVAVIPFKLDKVTDIALSVTGANSYAWRSWFDGLEDRWWRGAELVMKDLADHGMNCVNGGPNANLKEVKDGKAVIDYADMDRWLTLAVKAGLTHMADGYGGLDVAGLPRDSGPDCIAKTEKDSQARYGMPFKDLLRIVYGDYEQHMKDKGFPRRAHYILDEPRPEWNNIQPAAELIKVYTSACPDFLFSGYYSSGAGRDVYFQTMPISIAHAGKLELKLTKEAGKQLWEYDGQNVRYNIGRYLFAASRTGLAGYLRNGYMFVCGDPYFDFSADEASWCVVYPSRNGINGTVGWERTGEGVNDYRYLAMCSRLIQKARKAGVAAAEADAAEAYMTETMKTVNTDNRVSAALDPDQYDAFRHALGQHIAALNKALEVKP